MLLTLQSFGGRSSSSSKSRNSGFKFACDHVATVQGLVVSPSKSSDYYIVAYEIYAISGVELHGKIKCRSIFSKNGKYFTFSWNESEFMDDVYLSKDEILTIQTPIYKFPRVSTGGNMSVASIEILFEDDDGNTLKLYKSSLKNIGPAPSGLEYSSLVAGDSNISTLYDFVPYDFEKVVPESEYKQIVRKLMR